MPTITEATIRGYAHCVNAMCSGANQQEVAAVRVVTERTYRDVGSNLPGVENSYETFRFADPDEQACPGCGRSREVTDQQRPVYQPLSAGLSGAPVGGYAQDALLHVDQFDATRNARVDALQEQLVEMKAQMDAMIQSGRLATEES